MAVVLGAAEIIGPPSYGARHQVKKPEEHITDAKGDGIFREAFAQWGVNPSQQDYGWDYVVEVFRDNRSARAPRHVSTGLLFNAQLKSSIATSYSADGTFISQHLEMPSADYLARQLRQPTFLFHADVEKKCLFWIAIQLDSSILKALENTESKSLTVRIPTSNILAGSLDRFLEDLTKAHCVVVTRALANTHVTDFVEAMRCHSVGKMNTISEDLHERAFRLDMQAAHEIYRQGKLLDATGRLSSPCQNPTFLRQLVLS
ncbi:MAG: DUF4365 domain-containing protein, partial [Acidobacteriota bacterium]